MAATINTPPSLDMSHIISSGNHQQMPSRHIQQFTGESRVHGNLVNNQTSSSPKENFEFLPIEKLSIRDKLGFVNESKRRNSATPKSISVNSVVLILNDAIKALKNLTSNIPGLDKSISQLMHINDTLSSRENDLTQFFTVPIDKATAPPKTPMANNFADTPTSPLPRHPFSRPETETITLQHWIYDLQKNAWYLNEKTIRYEISITTILTMNSRKRKLIEMTETVYTSWVNLMLHLGLVLAQMNSESQFKTSTDLNRLVVATGLSEVVSGLDSNNFQNIYMQGEKHLLGYGVPQSYETAYKRFQVAGQNGISEAVNMLAVMNEFGIGCKKDIAAAIRYYMAAAAQSNSDAINHLGRLHELGKGCEVSLTKATKLYKKSAQLGNLDGITNFAHALQYGVGIDQQKELALEYYQMAADKGYARAMNAVGTCYYQGIGVKRDHFEAIGYYQKAADQGYAPAQNNLGICYEEGKGTPRDLVKAKKFYHLASEKRHPGGTNNFAYVLLLEKSYLEAIEQFYLAKSLGSVDSIFQLGHLYEIGCADESGVVLRPDIDMAIRFYREAGQRGHTQALLRLSSILICGPEKLVNIAKAVECLQKVADSSLDPLLSKGIKSKETQARDIAEAQNMLGELCEMGLHDGVDGTANVHLAAEWYRKALKYGHGRAMFNLGAIYEKGDVIPRDMDKAIRLFIESEKKGNEDARERLLKLQELGIISIQ